MKNYKNTKNSTQQNKFSLLSCISIICLSLFSFSSLQAQETDVKENTIVNQIKPNLLVKGTILDEYGYPLPYVNILLKGTTVGTTADENGGFEFPRKLKKGDVLSFSYVGYAAQNIVIEDNIRATNVQLKVAMSQGDIVLFGKAASKQVYKSSRK